VIVKKAEVLQSSQFNYLRRKLCRRRERRRRRERTYGVNIMLRTTLNAIFDISELLTCP